MDIDKLKEKIRSGKYGVAPQGNLLQNPQSSESHHVADEPSRPQPVKPKSESHFFRGQYDFDDDDSDDEPEPESVVWEPIEKSLDLENVTTVIKSITPSEYDWRRKTIKGRRSRRNFSMFLISEVSDICR